MEKNCCKKSYKIKNNKVQEKIGEIEDAFFSDFFKYMELE